MRKLSLLIAAILVSLTTIAQAPNLINYQAVVRDASGASVVSTTVGVQVSLLVASATGATAYSETHSVMTNQYGLINLKIGNGTVVSGDISSIAWGSNDFFLKVEVDPLGGSSYTITSTSQLVAVPYALHAATVENPDDADADPANEYNTTFVLSGTDLELTDGGGLMTVDLSGLVDDADADPENEAQTISKAGMIVTLSDVGGVTGGSFTDEVDDADADPDNEAQTLSKTGTTVTLTDVSGAGGGTFTDEVDDADADPDNEAQTISLTGTTVTLTDVSGAGGGSFSINDADANATNEAQTLSKTGTTVTLTDVSGTGGGTFTDEVDDADADPDNEAQTISLTGTTVTLTDVSGTGGGSFSINDADSDASNELITGGTLSGTDLEITDAGGTTTIDMSGLVGGGTRYYVGQKLFGGTVFWVDSSGLHGLVAAADPLAGTFIWDPTGSGTNAFNFGASNYDATSDFDGATNTTNAYTYWEGTAYTEPTYAVKAAQEHVEGGFTDWYLPSTWEMSLLVQNYYVLGVNSSVLIGNSFWTSTENDGAGTNSMAVNAMSSLVFTDSQLNTYKVWPIRAF